MAEKEYIERDAAINEQKRFCGYLDNDMLNRLEIATKRIPAADVQSVVVCANCEHNNHCLTQEFVDDCGKIPLDRNTFFCADGKRKSNA